MTTDRLTQLLKDRRVLVGLGAVVALTAGLGVAFMVSRDRGPTDAPPASQAGLVVQTGRDDDIKLDAKRPLRCFVSGKFVGELPLDECAKQNGVATGALDVGIDPSGALAASNGASADITPLPPQPVTPTPAAPVAGPAPKTEAPPQMLPVSTPIHGPTGACWRRVDADWKKLPADLTLNACVQVLYAGHCERGPGAVYGRWIDQTLRAVPGRIEVSADNRNFHTLVEQTASCSIPAIG